MITYEESIASLVSEYKKAVKDTKIYQAHHQCLDMTMLFLEKNDKESCFPSFSLLKMICERADVDHEYATKLDAFLAYRTSPHYHTKTYSTTFLRDELCDPFRDDVIAHCNEIIDPKTFWARGNLAFDNAWIPLDSDVAKYADWFQLSNSLHKILEDSGQSEQLLAPVEEIIEKARLDKSAFDKLNDWYNGSRWGDIQAVADMLPVQDDYRPVMESALHMLRVGRNSTWFNQLLTADDQIADAKKALVGQIMDKAKVDPIYAVEVDDYRRHVSWTHLITLANRAGVNTKENSIHQACCKIQRDHDYRVDEPEMSSFGM